MTHFQTSILILLKLNESGRVNHIFMQSKIIANIECTLHLQSIYREWYNTIGICYKKFGRLSLDCPIFIELFSSTIEYIKNNTVLNTVYSLNFQSMRCLEYDTSIYAMYSIHDYICLH